MADTTSPADEQQIESEVESILAETFAELEQISANIQREQVAIDRLKAESQIFTAHTDSLLSQIRIQLDVLAIG